MAADGSLLEFRARARDLLHRYPYLATDWRLGTLLPDLAAIQGETCACGTELVDCSCGDYRCPKCDPNGCPGG